MHTDFLIVSGTKTFQTLNLWDKNAIEFGQNKITLFCPNSNTNFMYASFIKINRSHITAYKYINSAQASYGMQ